MLCFYPCVLWSGTNKASKVHILSDLDHPVFPSSLKGNARVFPRSWMTWGPFVLWPHVLIHPPLLSWLLPCFIPCSSANMPGGLPWLGLCSGNSLCLQCSSGRHCWAHSSCVSLLNEVCPNHHINSIVCSPPNTPNSPHLALLFLYCTVFITF